MHKTTVNFALSKVVGCAFSFEKKLSPDRNGAERSKAGKTFPLLNEA